MFLCQCRKVENWTYFQECKMTSKKCWTISDLILLRKKNREFPLLNIMHRLITRGVGEIRAIKKVCFLSSLRLNCGQFIVKSCDDEPRLFVSYDGIHQKLAEWESSKQWKTSINIEMKNKDFLYFCRYKFSNKVI